MIRHSSTRPVIAILPARYASSRFPGKPLERILGKTLIQHSYENAKRCGILSQTIVATDDVRIYDHVQSFGGHVVMTADTCLNGTDRLADALRRHPICSDEDDAIIINIQGDEPCIDPLIIESVASLLLNDPESLMATAVTPLSSEDAHNRSIVKCVLDQNRYTLYYSRALIPYGKSGLLHREVPYYRHLGIYGYRKEFLLKYSQLPPTPLQLAEDIEALKAIEYGYRIKAAVVDGISIGVDHPEDIKKIERYLCKENQNTYS
jgi:3-deoxy-manno-octulosonate cytidylyltransferase (CMP-KDO synthetase)